MINLVPSRQSRFCCYENRRTRRMLSKNIPYQKNFYLNQKLNLLSLLNILSFLSYLTINKYQNYLYHLQGESIDDIIVICRARAIINWY